MPVQDQTARRLAATLALLVAVCGLAVAPSPATAAPRLLAAPGDNGDDGEGGSKSLLEQLNEASSGYVEAKAKLKKSQKQQADLTAEIKRLDSQVAPQQAALDEIAQQAYTTGRIGPMSALITANSTDTFLDRAETLATVAAQQNAAIADLRKTLSDRQKAKVAVDAAVRDQQKQVNVMARKKRDAEIALAEVGGGAAGGFVSASSPAAKPAPRNSDGSWPKESCTVNDPTSSGCITPRTLHAYQEARSDGFKRYTVCFSERSSGEHPKGRACDFSAAAGTFKNEAATGGDKSYGDSLAAYLVKNADELGVMYVIWYRQIWMPSTGWRAYSASGGPAAVHTNHVHLSML